MYEKKSMSLVMISIPTPVEKSKLYFANSLATVFSEAVLQMLLTFHVPNLTSTLYCLGRSKESVQIQDRM
jgi:hypothetical protein